MLLGEKIVRTYGVSLGFDPQGDKTRQGDGKTPEGTFYVAYGAPPRGTRYHRSLLVSYPSVERAKEGLDSGAISKAQYARIAYAQKRCRIPLQNTKLGGYILIHGGGGGAGYGDWTLGCVALTNDEVEEIHSISPAGCNDGVPRTKLVIAP